MIRKQIKCKICGGPHYAYQCFQRPKKVKNKPIVFPNKKASKGIQASNPIKYKGSERKDLTKALDKRVSEICRSRGSLNGWNWCYTCGKQLPIKELDCGHFISRRFIGTRFDLDNVRPQCRFCNRNLHGNLDVYEVKLRRELGLEKFDNLLERKNKRLTTPELRDLLDFLK